MLFLLACAVSLGCIAWMARALFVLRRMDLPSGALLVERREGASRADIEAELDELVLDLEQQTRAQPELARTLSRVSLASGTALSLLCFDLTALTASVREAVMTFAAGVVGAVGVAHVGRLARQRRDEVRSHYRAAIRHARGRLDSLPSSSRPSGAPPPTC